jgi:hypothetical protein
METVETERHPKEFRRFDAAMGKLLALPREEYQQRLAEYKALPKKRGRPAKVKPGASRVPAE